MRTMIRANSVMLRISGRETKAWADRWPCSQIRGKSLYAAFDKNGLVEAFVGGRHQYVDAAEFNAITADFLREKLPKDHPFYFMIVGQFDEMER